MKHSKSKAARNRRLLARLEQRTGLTPKDVRTSIQKYLVPATPVPTGNAN